jgi:hypothetical protein
MPYNLSRLVARNASGQDVPLSQIYPFNPRPIRRAPCETNGWDACTEKDKQTGEWLLSREAFTIQPSRSSYRRRLKLNQIGRLALPGATGTYAVLTYTVPKGYKGSIEQIVNGFLPGTGAAYQNGSGLLTWHLGINNWYVFGYGNISVDLGSLTQGYELTGSVVALTENDIITFSATLTGVAFGPGNLVAAIQGWIEPLR